MNKLIKVVLASLSGKELARLLFSAASHLAAPHVHDEALRVLKGMSEEGFKQSGADALEYHDAVEAGDRDKAATVVARAVGRFKL